MTDTIRVRPRTGIILPGIPRKGASIPRALAEEWIADRLVVRLEPLMQPVAGATKPSKQRSR
jgi:hypothetical protein